jgi:hypothetical protein
VLVPGQVSPCRSTVLAGVAPVRYAMVIYPITATIKGRFSGRKTICQ